MKKLVILAIAVLLAMPVLSHAGSATSRWDLTINGYVAVIGQFADQETAMWGPATNAARRTGKVENRTDQFSNFSMQIDPRITFLVKGPDAFGAKTSAMIQFDFSGMGSTAPTSVAGGAGADNGEAKIRYAFMKFDWANDSILFGNWVWNYRDGSGGGPPPGYGTLVALPGQFGAPRETMLRWEHRFGKAFSTKLALVYPTLEGWKLDGFGGNSAANSDWTRSNLPFVSGQVRYASDACGRIGMFNLAAGMSGVYGQKAIMRDANTPTTTTRGRWSQVQDDGWLAEAFFMIPIIPERNMNKAGALLFYANAMTGQGLTPYSPQLFPAAYARTGSAGTARDYAAPKGKAWDVGFMVYLSDTVWLSPSYNDMSTMLSSRYRTFVATDTTVKRTQNYNLFLGYAPTPALTLGLEYTRIITNYARYSLTSTTPDGLKNWGTANAVRFGAYYYF